MTSAPPCYHHRPAAPVATIRPTVHALAIGTTQARQAAGRTHAHMPLADHAEELDELATVEAWRLQQLIDAGWAYHRAELLAGRTDINLHQAIDLIQHGCPQRTALKILL